MSIRLYIFDWVVELDHVFFLFNFFVIPLFFSHSFIKVHLSSHIAYIAILKVFSVACIHVLLFVVLDELIWTLFVKSLGIRPLKSRLVQFVHVCSFMSVSDSLISVARFFLLLCDSSRCRLVFKISVQLTSCAWHVNMCDRFSVCVLHLGQV